MKARITRKDVKRAIGWIENSNAVYNTDEKLMKIVSKAKELREVKMSQEELDKYVSFYGELPCLELTGKKWEDKVYYYYNLKSSQKNSERKVFTEQEKEIISDWLGRDDIPDSVEITDKESWAGDYADFWEVSTDEALNDLKNGNGYIAINMPTGGMVAVEENSKDLFFVSDMRK